MIRFRPDTWLEAFLRFFLMAAPDANIYVEIPAPDLRFAAMVFLGIAVMVFWRKLVGNPAPAMALLVLLLACAAVWLTTSGNGRYFMPMLLCIGPLVVALVYLLPLSRAFRFFLAGGLLALQTFVMLQNSPWDAWAWLPWGDSRYFRLDAPRSEPAAVPVTYVTLTSISYSLIAPQFPQSSRWINITSVGALERDRLWGQDFLRAAKGPIRLVVPSIPGQAGADGGPGPDVRKALDDLLSPQRLALEPGASCDLLRSQGLAAISGKRGDSEAAAQPIGFWVCPLRFPVDMPAVQTKAIPAKVEATFTRIEQMCPRFFPHGSTRSMPINGGVLRHYPHSDTKVYVLDDGRVLYKFWRALNPVLVGTVDGVLAGTDTVRCDQIRGAGLPWGREI